MPGSALLNIPPALCCGPQGWRNPPGTNSTACQDCPLSHLAQNDSEAGSWPGASTHPGTKSSQNWVPQ